MNYPINNRLVRLLKTEYEKEAETKGDSWEDCSITFLKEKLDEEFVEVKQAFFNEHTNDEALAELLDLIEVAGMLYRRLSE